jgi:hypothetical protein
MFKNAVWTLALIGWPDLGLLAINHVVSPGTRVNISIIIIYYYSLRLFLLIFWGVELKAIHAIS